MNASNNPTPERTFRDRRVGLATRFDPDTFKVLGESGLFLVGEFPTYGYAVTTPGLAGVAELTRDEKPGYALFVDQGDGDWNLARDLSHGQALGIVAEWRVAVTRTNLTYSALSEAATFISRMALGLSGRAKQEAWNVQRLVTSALSLTPGP